MRILDRYILKTALSVFLACLCIFIFLYIIIDIFSHLDEILKQQVSLSILKIYYLSYFPIIFVQVAPISCLLATLYTFSKLNRDNEIIAMRASGLSIFQITRTVIIFSVIVSLFLFWINDRFVPQSVSLNQKIKEEMDAGRKKESLKKQEVIYNLSMYGQKNRLYFINRFLPDTNKMEGIVILEQDEEQNITRKVVANEGVYKEGSWRFYQCITYDFDNNGQIKGEPKYQDEEVMSIAESPREFLNQRQHPDFMSIAQLQNYILKLSDSGATTAVRNLKVDLYQRFTFPLTSIIIVLLGIPFALMIKKRAATLSSLGISIMLAFLYYVFSAVSIALGKAGILTPILAASLSHLFFLIVSLYLINILP